jgi:hypothetical protein
VPGEALRQAKIQRLVQEAMLRPALSILDLEQYKRDRAELMNVEPTENSSMDVIRLIVEAT